MQSKKRAKAAEPKRACHVHAVGQHHELRIVTHARSDIQHQRDAQNHKPHSARHRNHPRDNAQHRVRNPKRALRGSYSGLRSRRNRSRNAQCGIMKRTPRNMCISMLAGSLRRTLWNTPRIGRRRKIRLLHCELLNVCLAERRNDSASVRKMSTGDRTKECGGKYILYMFQD